MNLSASIRNTFFVLATVAITHFAAHAQTGNSGGNSGGTGGGQHGEGSGPGFNSPGMGASSFSGDPDANPYASATPTPHDSTAGVAPPPEGTPKHGKAKKGDTSGNTNPSH